MTISSSLVSLADWRLGEDLGFWMKDLETGNERERVRYKEESESSFGLLFINDLGHENGIVPFLQVTL